MVNLILWLAIGATLGWLANYLFGQSGSPLFNIALGMAGALLAGYGLTAVLHTTTTLKQGNFTWPTLLVPLPGGILLLAIAGLFRHGQPSQPGLPSSNG